MNIYSADLKLKKCLACVNNSMKLQTFHQKLQSQEFE